jgi:hypothetical protein
MNNARQVRDGAAAGPQTGSHSPPAVTPLHGPKGTPNLPPRIGSPEAGLDSLDVAAANLHCALGLPGAEALDVSGCLAQLDQWAARVQAETQRHRHRFGANPREFDHSEGYFRMLMMAVVVAEDFGVRYNPARMGPLGPASGHDGFFADSRDVFLHGLLGPGRLGTCSSMPILYLALGRRLGYPLKLVTTKAHRFLRWEDATERFNLEATGRGMNRYDDDHYRQWPFPVTDQEMADHGYLKSLTPAEELAVFLSIRSQCLREHGRWAEAEAALAEAARLAPMVKTYRLLLAQAQAARKWNWPWTPTRCCAFDDHATPAAIRDT